MANHLRTELVLAALNMALGQRQAQGVVHHSVRGSQYTSLACVFRSKPITHSSPNRSLIPFQADHRFQPMPITDSSPMPITFGVGTGTVRGV